MYDIEFRVPPEILNQIEAAGGPGREGWRILSITPSGVTFYIVARTLPQDACIFIPMANIAAINSGVDADFLADLKAHNPAANDVTPASQAAGDANPTRYPPLDLDSRRELTRRIRELPLSTRTKNALTRGLGILWSTLEPFKGKDGSIAVMGFYDPESGQPLSFNEWAAKLPQDRAMQMNLREMRNFGRLMLNELIEVLTNGASLTNA